MATPADRTTSNLCHRCATALEQDLGLGQADIGCKFKCLRESAQDGCPTCNWLWNSKPWLYKLGIPTATPAPDRGDDISVLRHATVDIASEAALSRLYESVYEARAFEYETNTLRITGNVWPVLKYSAILAPFETNVLPDFYKPSVNTGASETFHLARHWMNQCLTSHDICNAHRRPHWAPTRLLKVFPEDGGKISAKLEEQDQGHYSSNVEYIALSHRWLGDLESPLLSEKNRSQFRRKIKISSLKASIRDAIYATVRLGIDHLWIDTLCVLQDNKEDKTHEIGRMDSVYSNALCTIAAGVGETADEGCFLSRDVNQVKTHRMHLRFGGNESQYYNLRLSWDDTERELDDTSLSGRGWTFQERFLSPRTLHFCSKQVHWECRQFKANETHPDGDPAKSNRRWNLKFMDMATPWKKIIEAYTTRSLTFPADRLRAIQGVADFLQRDSTAKGQPDKYLHGLWRSSLLEFLLWGLKHEPRHDRLTKVAPTWSWASTNEEISFHDFGKLNVYDQGSPLVEILEILNSSDIDTTDADRGLETKNGIIKLRGRFQWSPRHQGVDSQLSGRNIQYDCRHTGQGDSEARNEYLPIFKAGSFETNDRFGGRFIGLIVRASSGRSPNSYERVGKYEDFCRSGWGNLPLREEQDIYLC